jgi:hypothetical protein
VVYFRLLAKRKTNNQSVALVFSIYNTQQVKEFIFTDLHINIKASFSIKSVKKYHIVKCKNPVLSSHLVGEF